MSVVKVRGSTGESILYKALRTRTIFKSRWARGASCTFKYNAAVVAIAPSASAGQTILNVLTPAARIATNSSQPDDRSREHGHRNSEHQNIWQQRQRDAIDKAGRNQAMKKSFKIPDSLLGEENRGQQDERNQNVRRYRLEDVSLD